MYFGYRAKIEQFFAKRLEVDPDSPLHSDQDVPTRIREIVDVLAQSTEGRARVAGYLLDYRERDQFAEYIDKAAKVV